MPINFLFDLIALIIAESEGGLELKTTKYVFWMYVMIGWTESGQIHLFRGFRAQF